jgi:phytoene desaturase
LISIENIKEDTEMKKVVIIGAGIAGLTCGIYARKNGFDTEIYESHTIAGGECTGWDRKGYHFDGCIHWLVGSKPGTSLNKVWRDNGAIDDTVKFMHYDVFSRYEEDGKEVVLYTDAKKLEKHLLSIAPEDKTEIKRLCKAIRTMGGFGMPIDRPMDMMTKGDIAKMIIKGLGSMSGFMRYRSLTIGGLLAGFKNPLIKRAILASYPEHYTCMALITTLAGMNAGDCGYPMGGSRALAKRMEAKYLSLGGKVFYRSKADKILVVDGKAKGIRLADGKEILADHVVSCADAYATLKFMLGDKFMPPEYDKLFSRPADYPTVTCSLVFMGVNAKLPHDSRGFSVRRKQPAELNGLKADNISFLSYSHETGFAPEGKSVAACFYQANYDYWKALSADKEKYEAEKEKLSEDAVRQLSERFPETIGKVEVTDVVTPVTYEHYCAARRGAWMTWVGVNDDIPKYYPGVLPGLDNFIMAGMWTLPPGGLPGAAVSGKFAAHRLCIQNGIPFKTN